MNVHPEIEEYFKGRQQVDRELADLYQKVKMIKENQDGVHVKDNQSTLYGIMIQN